MSTNSGKSSACNRLKPAFLLLICLITLIFRAEAQIDLRTYTTATDTFYWKRYIQIPEPPRVSLRRFCVSGGKAKQAGERFLEQNKMAVKDDLQDSLHPMSDDDLRKLIFPIDLNGDQLPDIILSGKTSRSAGFVRIWMNHGGSFEPVFEDYQSISQFRIEGTRLTALQTADIGSDGQYLYFTRDYKIQWEGNDPVFVRGKQVVSYMHTREPSVLLREPTPFTARADTMLLRASPSRQDEPFIPALGTFGNIIAKYRSEAKGTVLASYAKVPGNDWFYVEVDPSVMPSASILYDTDKLPTFIRGWVSGRAIRTER